MKPESARWTRRIGECCHGDTPEEVIPPLLDIAEDLAGFFTEKGQLLPEPLITSISPDPAAIRTAMGLSQTKFAQLIGASVLTLHKWEHHTSSPSGAAKTLLKIAATNPQAVREVLRSD